MPPPVEVPRKDECGLGRRIGPGTVGLLRDSAAGRKVLVLADGAYSANHVLQERCLYAPLIPTGSYLVAADGVVDVMDWKEFAPGPAVAAERFVAETSEFVIDRTREKFLLTYAPGGFLKRVHPAIA